MLDMMDAVARLEAIAAEHADQFELFTEQFHVLSEQVSTLSRGARATDQQFRRVARLLVELANDHQRIEGLESRVEKLERKAG